MTRQEMEKILVPTFSADSYDKAKLDAMTDEKRLDNTGGRYDNQKTIGIYGMTRKQAALAQEAYENLDTEAGYKAYYELSKLTKDKNLNDSVLVDLACDFAWDERLSEAYNRLALADNRKDLVEE